ncbi:MAG: class II aldolase/adducin family protein, partial [Anaerolineae bacterium]
SRTITVDGTVVQGERKPSSELKMHLEVYRLREDVQAVVHAHPPYATAFALAGVPLDQCLLPESVLTMGAIPLAPYATPSTEEIPASIRDYITKADAVLLANHGAVVWADSLEAAYYRMETLEHTATITHHALALGGPKALDAQQVDKLKQVRDRMGLTGRCLPCEAAGTSPAAESPATA